MIDIQYVRWVRYDSSVLEIQNTYGNTKIIKSLYILAIIIEVYTVFCGIKDGHLVIVGNTCILKCVIYVKYIH
jgi:hypothetical protein